MTKNHAKLQQLKIYFLFMNADGELSPGETELLGTITKDQPDDLAEGFQAFCGRMTLQQFAGGKEATIHQIAAVLEEKTDLSTDKVLQAETIWTLINLGNADGVYSEVEKEIVSYLARRWDVDPILMAELNDTADALLALEAEKAWIQSTSRPYAEINTIMQELDRSTGTMFEHVMIAVKEADIA